MIPVGRTVIVPANGSLPNIILSPRSVYRMRRVLESERFESYRKLQRELHWLEIRHDARARSEERKRWRASNKEARARARP